jgi:hypothetical protein
MSAVIEFFAKVGQNADLRASSVVDVESALREALIEGEEKTAILMEDWRKLESLLGAQQHICCAVHRPDDDEDEDEDEDDADQDDQDEDSLTAR